MYMDDFELLKGVYELFLHDLESRNDDDYEVDKIQMAKLVRAYQFFSKLAKRDGGRVEPFDITPKMVHSGITAYFRVFYVALSEMEEFKEIVQDMTALTLDTTVDGEVCISFNIPNVFRLKEEAELE